MVNRNENNINFKYPFSSLLSLPVESWESNSIPDWLNEIPITKPGSTGK